MIENYKLIKYKQKDDGFERDPFVKIHNKKQRN